MANQGIYTNTAWSHGVQFQAPDGTPLALAGLYECDVIDRDQPNTPVFTFRAADGTLDHTEQAQGRLRLFATVAQHAAVGAGLYRLHMRRVDNATFYWAAEGQVQVGKPGDLDTFIVFSNATDGSTPTSFVPALGGPAGQTFFLTGTSLTSYTPALGPATFATQSGRGWVAGQWVTVTSTAAPTQRFVSGVVTSYSGGTLGLNIAALGPDVTADSSWVIAAGSAHINDGTYGDVAVFEGDFRIIDHPYVIDSVAEFAALNPNERPVVLLAADRRTGVFKFENRDGSADLAADPFNGMVAKGAPAATTGIYARQGVNRIEAAWFGVAGDVDEGNPVANGTDAQPALQSALNWAVRREMAFFLSPPIAAGYRLNAPLRGRSYVDMLADNDRWAQLFPVGAVTALTFGEGPSPEYIYHQKLKALRFNGKYATGSGGALSMTGTVNFTNKIGEMDGLWISGFLNTSVPAVRINGNSYAIVQHRCHYLDNARHLEMMDNGLAGVNQAFPVANLIENSIFEGGGDNSSAAVRLRNAADTIVRGNVLQNNRNLYTMMVEATANRATMLPSFIDLNYFEMNTRDGAGNYKAGGIEVYLFGAGASALDGAQVTRNRFRTSAANMVWADNVRNTRVDGNTGGDPATVPLRTTGFQGPGNFYNPVLMDGNPVMGAGSAVRYLQGATNFDPPSLATGASTTTTVTVTGAAVGDFVEYVAGTQIAPGFTINGEVTAVNTVTVTISNVSAANPTDLANGTITVRVSKR